LSGNAYCGLGNNSIVGEVWLCQGVQHSTLDVHHELQSNSRRCSTVNTKTLIRIAFQQFGIEDR
jgi:hypothetical protein